MANQNFTLIVEGRDVQEDEVIDALFESGCDDGTAGNSDGVQFLVFDREANSLGEALLSAVEDIERVQGLTVVRVADGGYGPDATIGRTNRP